MQGQFEVHNILYSLTSVNKIQHKMFYYNVTSHACNCREKQEGWYQKIKTQMNNPSAASLLTFCSSP